MSKSTIATCLADIGVDSALLKTMNRIEDEFALIKKTYFKKVLIVHPDKGGDEAQFRKINEAFEALREIFEKKSAASFASALGRNAEAKLKNLDRSWDFYNDAFDVAMPIYKVELAKSGRSKCVQKTKSAKMCFGQEVIDKGEVRIGSIDLESGSYTRWMHLNCWRVPSRIWLGIPDPEVCQDKSKFEEALSSMNEVLFTGFDALSPTDKDRVIIHIMDKSHWAKLTHRKGPVVSESTLITGPVKLEKEDMKALPASYEPLPQVQDQNQLDPFQQELVPVKGFKMPVKTNQNANYLLGKTVVLTGIFPEAGGGAGLSLGKDKVKEMVTNFGGRVTSSISGKTDYLIVGDEPGFSKVSKARTQPKCQLLSLSTIKNAIESGHSESLQSLPPVVVDSFSAGYYGSSTLALTASERELGIAQGHIEAPLLIKAPKRSAMPDSSSVVVKKPKVTKVNKTKPDSTSAKKPKTQKVKTEPVQRSKQLDTFMEISGLSKEAAVEILSSKNWDLELCINEFLSENSRATSSRASAATPSATAKRSGWIDMFSKGIDTLLYLLKLGIILILGKEQIKRLTDFSKNYEEEFGKVHPEFFQGTYTQALEAGKREAKWILIALYMKEHPGNKFFCKNVISSSQLSSYIREKNGLFWMGDTQTEQGLQVLQVLSVTKHPFLAVIGQQNGRNVVFDRIQGDYSIQETLYRLSQIITRIEPFLQGIREERVTRQADRSIREQQDEAYQASLKADQEKDRLAKVQKEEKEKEDRIQLDKEKEKTRKTEEKKKRKQELIKKFEQEPSDSKDTTKLSIRLPSGQRIVRKFEVSSSIRTVYEFVETQELAPLSLEAEFVLVKTFPRVVLQDLETDLESCGLLPTGSLIVEEKL